MILLRMNGHSEELAPVSLTTIVTAAVNAIGLGLQLDHGMIPMLHADANQALVIPQTLLTTQTHQTTQPLTAGPSEVRAPARLMTIAMEVANATGPGLLLALGKIPMPHADANQALLKLTVLLTTSTRSRAGNSEAPVPVSQMTSVTAAVNAIGPGLQLDHGTILMPHAGVNQVLAIALTHLKLLIPPTTRTRQTVQILLTALIPVATRPPYLSPRFSQASKQFTTILTTAILSSQGHSIRSTRP
jgi:hypothetical protein